MNSMDRQNELKIMSGAKAALSVPGFPVRFSNDEYTVLPGFCDVHVHFREPGFSYKETIASGSAAAAKGGFTAVCPMPNLNPVPDSKEKLELELELIRKNAVVNVIPYGALTCCEMGKEQADLCGMAPDVVAFSDDGKGVQSREMMESLMLKAKSLGKIIAAHCEDNSLLRGGYIHDGVYAAAHGHRGICSESEWGPIARDVELAAKTGCSYHVCHVSSRESVEIIRQAKKSGVDVSCETGPHYLILCDEDLQENGRFKMNPPLRSAQDREALLEGIIDGTIDMIATDHAPHSASEKSRGLEESAFGVVGLETSFASLYTKLVLEKKLITLDKLVDLMAYNPRARFNIQPDGYSVWKLDEAYTVNPEDFLTMGRATPFEGMKFYGTNYFTYCRGRAAYERKE